MTHLTLVPIAAPATETGTAVATVAASVLPCATVGLAKDDHRCRGWAILVRGDTPLPEPADVSGASCLGRPYLRQAGTEELFGTDAVLFGEEVHHRKSRGWNYWMQVRDPETGKLVRVVADAANKGVVKQAILDGEISLPLEVLKGAGEVAGLVRILHAIRAGMPVAVFD